MICKPALAEADMQLAVTRVFPDEQHGISNQILEFSAAWLKKAVTVALTGLARKAVRPFTAPAAVELVLRNGIPVFHCSH